MNPIRVDMEGSSDDIYVSFAAIDDEINNENVNESGSDNSIDDDVEDD